MTLIAIDGPGGSGKSTLAAELATRLGLARLDTGAMYRALALAAMQAGLDATDTDAVIARAQGMELEMGPPVLLDGRDVSAAIRTPEIDAAVSAFAAIPGVRAELVARQRAFITAHNRDAIVEGRDIGTVVAPDADLKIFLTASADERARRRAAERDAAEQVERDQLIARDTADSTRVASPLLAADDAIELDSTTMDIEQVTQVVLEHLGARR